jgi:hypothetical protein
VARRRRATSGARAFSPEAPAEACLRDVARLRAEGPRLLQREFVREVFQRIVVEGPEILAITARPMHIWYKSGSEGDNCEPKGAQG